MDFLKTKNIKLSIIKEMELLAAKVPGAVSLAQGIPSFETPESIKNFAKKALDYNLASKYSLCTGLPQLREIISEKLKREKMDYDYDKEILVTAGAIEGITSSLLAILEPGDEVLLPSPTYASYPEAVKIASGVPVFVPLDEEKGWKINTNAFKGKVTEKTKAILFCNPNNPTSTIYKKEELKELEKLAKEHNLFIITDEVYKDFIYPVRSRPVKDTATPIPSFGATGQAAASGRPASNGVDDDSIEFYSPAQNPKMKDKIIRVFSFSKTFAMTGWRVGFIHSSRENITEILKVHDAVVTCAPVISQYAAIGAFEMAENEISKFKEEFLRRRKIILERLDNLKNIFSYQKPNAAYFVFPKITQKTLMNTNNSLITTNRKSLNSVSYNFALELLYKAKVATVPGIAFGPTGEGHLRMSFGASPEIINEAFDRMEKYFKESS